MRKYWASSANGMVYTDSSIYSNTSLYPLIKRVELCKFHCQPEHCCQHQTALKPRIISLFESSLIRMVHNVQHNSNQWQDCHRSYHGHHIQDSAEWISCKANHTGPELADTHCSDIHKSSDN